MRKRTWSFGLALVSLLGLLAFAAGPSQAAPSEQAPRGGDSTAEEASGPRAYPDGLPGGLAMPRVSVQADTCGRGNPMNAVQDGSGGWWIGWRNCWGDNGHNVAPVWFNGIGNTYANVRTYDGYSRCGYIPNDGNVYWWHIPWHELPPENTTYTGVVYCLDY